MDKDSRIAFLKSCTPKQRREYYSQVVRLGCAACGRYYTETGDNRTAAHHCYGNSFPAKREHRPVIGLCSYDCHQYGELAIHRAKDAFQKMYGTQDELLEKVEARLEGSDCM